MIENKKKILILMFLVVCFFVFLKIIVYQSTEEKVTNYIKKNGYTHEGNSTIYNKLISKDSLDDFEQKVSDGKDASYEENYFFVSQYQLIKNKMDCSDGIISSFTPTYDYKNGQLSYNYRISIAQSVIIFDGTYDYEKEKFTCENTYYYNYDIYREKGEICNKIEYDVIKFYHEAFNFITSARLLDEMSS